MQRFAWLVFILFGLAACTRIASAPTATPLDLRAQRIVIEAPPAGATISSPLLVRGSAATLPAGGNLQYRVYDGRGTLVGSGPIVAQPIAGTAARFEGQVVYAAAQSGPGKIEVLDYDAATSAIRAGAEIVVYLTGPGGVVILPTPVPGQVTVLPAIVTAVPRYPAPATVLPGSATQLPGMATQLPGMATPGAAATAPTATAAVIVPAVTPNPGSNVGNAQQITFDTPAPTTLVGSPVLIAGRTARYPYQGNLSYTIRDAAGQVVGQGLIGVDGAEGQPASFRVELNFNTAAEPGALTIELADEDAVSGTVAARAVLQLSYGRIASVPTSTPAPAAPGGAQVITIESPAPNTNIGSPAVLLGRVSMPPASGRLYYRVSDANGSPLGEGSF